MHHIGGLLAIAGFLIGLAVIIGGALIALLFCGAVLLYFLAKSDHATQKFIIFFFGVILFLYLLYAIFF